MTAVAQKNEGEVHKLMKEINSLQEVNRTKEEVLERITIEKEEILENLKVQEIKLEEVKDKISHEALVQIEVSSLSDELGINDPCASNSNVASNKTEVHRKGIKVLETNIFNQKMKLIASLFKLKE